MAQIKPITYTSDSGETTLCGISLTALSERYGTPLYLMDAHTLRQNCRSYVSILSQQCSDFLVLYAGKANLNLALLQLVAQEGLGVDVVSGGELFTALKAGISPDRIYFHGNNKSVSELKLAVQSGVRLVVDNQSELTRIAALASSESPVRILLRLKPEIDAHTHDFIKTGNIDSKFGFDIRFLKETVQYISTFPMLRLVGLHSHIGSQIFDIEPYLELALRMVGHMTLLRDSFGITLEEINFGGGMGIMYVSSDDPPEVPAMLSALLTRFYALCESENFAIPRLLFEPGRSIVGPAGITLYSIGTVKEIPDVKTYVFVDGGMADNPRPMMYGASYTFEVANKQGKPLQSVSIAGKYCESGDILAENVSLNDPQEGDLLVVFGTGAYNYSMASHYNRNSKPAMVLVEKGQSQLIVERESFEDLIRFDKPLEGTF